MNYKMQIATLAKALREKEISSVELTEMCLLKIKEKDSEIGAFLSVLEEKALRQAAQFDACREERKWSSPLAGIPFGVKDNICLLDAPMTCGSKMLMNFTAPYEATVVQKLRLCHAIPLGKTNMDEFGMGSTTEYSAFHVTRNPLSLDRVPGGSSGGSAAAVAAGMVPFALGSDTGGSVRLPASYCGLVGLRPTYGAFSRYGLTAFCSSMDTVGVLTSTVRDNRLVYETMAGVDQNDATSRPMDPCYEEMPEKLRVGILSQLMGEGISDIAIETVERAAQSLARGGHDVFCVSIPSLKDSLFAYFMISSAEASSNLARFDGVRYGYRSPNANDTESMYRQSRSGGFGEEVKRRIRLGTYALSKENREAYYERSLAVKERLQAEFMEVFAHCDVILCPTAADVAPEFGRFSEATEMYATDLCTVAPSLAGLPVLSVPFGQNKAELPVGVQLIGREFSENLLYHVGECLERGKDA